jgi:hypothetical protein
MSDFEFVLISDGIDNPGVREVLQQLRREPRTARLPIAVLAREENFDRMEQLTSTDPLSMTFTAPYEPVGMAFLISRLRERAGASYVTSEERMQQAAASLDALAALAAKPERYGFYDLIAQQSAVERATATPRLNERAAQVLGLLATPAAQRWLVSLASQNNRAISQRQAAAKAFDAAVQRRGLLLTRDEILMQYDRYNASATRDQQTQQVLGAMLDSIESLAADKERSPSTVN